MRKAIKLLVFLIIVVGGYLLLRPHVLWLDSFEAEILTRVEKSVPTVVDKRHAQNISEYYFDILTDDGRELTVPVDQLTYFKARVSMRVAKQPFSSEISLIE